MTVKAFIKKKVPKKIIYDYRVIKMLPEYSKVLVKDRATKYPEIKFYSDVEVVDKILKEKKSLCRFGDGEFMWMLNIELDNSFQKCSRELAERLKEIFLDHREDILIGIPKGIVNSTQCNMQAKIHWRIVKSKYYKKICEFMPLNKIYCDASITRPYIDYKDKTLCEARFENLKRIWHCKDILIVEGKDSKLGVGNDLFDNAKSIKRIICPGKNAYDSYNEILNKVLETVKEELILISLGPTATILAADLSGAGYQAIDIGHIDIEYMWFLNKAKYKEPIKGKYVGESGVKELENIYDSDEKYINSICGYIE